jgi:hypothetical protein
VSYMNTTLAILLAQSLSLIACILFAVWYVVPWLQARSRTEALLPLVWMHVMRNLALQLYSAQQAGFAISDAARDHNVIGDVVGMILALVALIALRMRAGFAPLLVWLLVAETLYDIGTGMPQAIQDHTLGLVNGLTWIVLVYYVPIILVSLALTLWQLLARRAEPIAFTPPRSS